MILSLFPSQCLVVKSHQITSVMGVSIVMGVPLVIIHIFRWIFPNKNHPNSYPYIIGVPPWRAGKPQMFGESPRLPASPTTGRDLGGLRILDALPEGRPERRRRRRRRAARRSFFKGEGRWLEIFKVDMNGQYSWDIYRYIYRLCLDMFSGEWLK